MYFSHMVCIQVLCWEHPWISTKNSYLWSEFKCVCTQFPSLQPPPFHIKVCTLHFYRNLALVRKKYCCSYGPSFLISCSPVLLRMFFICNLASFFIYWALSLAASKDRILRFFIKLSVIVVMSQILFFIIAFWEKEVNVLAKKIRGGNAFRNLIQM